MLLVRSAPVVDRTTFGCIPIIDTYPYGTHTYGTYTYGAHTYGTHTYGAHTYGSLLQETKMSLSLQGTSFRDLDRRADRVNHAPMASKLTRHTTVEWKTAFSLVVSDWQVSESSTWTTSTGHRECTRR